MPLAHHVPEGVVRGTEGREVARGTEGSLLAQPEGQVEVGAGNGSVDCSILVDHGEQAMLEAAVVLEELALPLRRSMLNTDPNLGSC